jgi:hypothetical protein
MQFVKATRKRVKLRVLIASPAGGGKTQGALSIARGLGGKTAVIDTERGSASHYSDRFDFDALDLDPPYSPERFIEAIKAAESAGYQNLIIDSITHEWDGAGGVLEINEQLAQAKYRGNTWSAWSDSTPRHRAFIDAMLQCNMHVIATARSKTETVQGEDKKVRKVGMKIEQRASVEYEFSVVWEIDHSSHLAIATKDRTQLFAEPAHLTPDTGTRLLAWLASGAEVVPTQAEIAAKRREDISLKFAQALNPSGDLGTTEEDHERAIAAAVFAVHNEVREMGEEEYRAVWQMIPATSRAALKKYIEMAKLKEMAA